MTDEARIDYVISLYNQKKYKDALKTAKEIQKRHRLLILYQDYIGDIKKIYKPKLSAIGSGERANIAQKRRSLKVKRIAI